MHPEGIARLRLPLHRGGRSRTSGGCTDEQHLKLYTDYRGRLEASRQSAFDQFDKAILTLSSAALGISIAFIKDAVPLSQARSKPLLVVSWIGFSAAVLSTVISFLLSQEAFTKQIQAAQDYFVDNNVDALQRKNQYSEYVRWLNISSIACFTAAVLLTVTFVSINILGDLPNMTSFLPGLSTLAISALVGAVTSLLIAWYYDLATSPRLEVIPDDTPRQTGQRNDETSASVPTGEGQTGEGKFTVRFAQAGVELSGDHRSFRT
jgi:hypothetical protein